MKSCISIIASESNGRPNSVDAEILILILMRLLLKTMCILEHLRRHVPKVGHTSTDCLKTATAPTNPYFEHVRVQCISRNQVVHNTTNEHSVYVQSNRCSFSIKFSQIFPNLKLTCCSVWSFRRYPNLPAFDSDSFRSERCW